MSETIPCRFHSEWDGGYVVSSDATIDLESGKIVDIGQVDADVFVSNLDREYVTLAGSDTEFEVDGISGDEYRVANYDRVRQAIEAARPAVLGM